MANHARDMAEMTDTIKRLQEAVGKYHAGLFRKVSEVAASGSSAAVKARAAAASVAAASAASSEL